jgi:hypothetical protein
VTGQAQRLPTVWLAGLVALFAAPNTVQPVIGDRRALAPGPTVRAPNCPSPLVLRRVDGVDQRARIDTRSDRILRPLSRFRASADR